MIISPRELGVPHPEWRPYQYEAYQWLAEQKRGAVSILELGTGLGKSSLAAAIGHDYRTIVLTETKALQAQYHNIYNLAIVTGRQNHPCIHEDKLFPDATAEDCLFPGQMHQCPFSAGCSYLIQKEIALAARKKTLNYHYSNLVINRKYTDTGRYIWERDYIFLDEAHSLSKSCVDFYSIELSPKHKAIYGLADFPYITSGMPQNLQHDRALMWIDDSKALVGARVYDLQREIKTATNDTERKHLIWDLRRAERIRQQLSVVARAVQSIPDDWYISSNEGGLLAKPLTSRHIFPAMFLQDLSANIVLMSATIGDFANFAEELGIEQYESRVVPSRFPPESRPILVPNCPRMSAKATEQDFEMQADVIADLINDCPGSWSGIILVTRKAESVLLKERLTRRGLGKRIWAMPGYDGVYTPTDEQIQLWGLRKQKVPGSIAISWSHWTGADLLDEKICIAAKCLTPDMKLYGPDGKYIGIDDVSEGDRVFSITEDGELVIDRVKSIIRQKYTGNIHTYKSTKIDMSVTENHQMLFLSSNDTRNLNLKTWRKDEASSVPSHVSIPVSSRVWYGQEPADHVDFSGFFSDDTLIWYKPKEKPNRWHTTVPSFFAPTRFGQQKDRRRLYVAKWEDVKESGWKPELDEAAFFSDGKGRARVPYYWRWQDFIVLLGWYITEGYTCATQWHGHIKTFTGISQNKDRYLDEITETLDKIGLRYSVTYRGDRGDEINICSAVVAKMLSSLCGKGARNKSIPRLVLNSDMNTLNLLFQTMMKGDGNAAMDTFSTSSDILRDNFIELALKIGYAPSYNQYSSIYHIYVSKKDGTMILPKNVEIEHYDGYVWCVETEKTGNILVTRNGRFTFTGNCPFPPFGAPGSYDEAWRRYSSNRYFYTAAVLLTQGLGRTRRGREQDYDLGERRGLVAIVDGSFNNRIANLMGEDIKASLRT